MHTAKEHMWGARVCGSGLEEKDWTPRTRPKERGGDLTEGGHGTSRDHTAFLPRAMGPFAQNPYSGEHEENRPSRAEAAYLPHDLGEVL